MIDGVIMQAAAFEAKVPEHSEHCWCTHNADSQVSIKQYFYKSFKLKLLYIHINKLCLNNCSVLLLLVATFYFFAIIGMEAFRYQVYPQCWYGIYKPCHA